MSEVRGRRSEFRIADFEMFDDFYGFYGFYDFYVFNDFNDLNEQALLAIELLEPR